MLIFNKTQRFPQLEKLTVFVRRFSEWFELATVEVGKRQDGERVQTPSVSVAELAAAIGLPPVLPYDRLCDLAYKESCNVVEILQEQGQAGWGTASLLTAEKLVGACVQLLTARQQDFRVVFRAPSTFGAAARSGFGRGGSGRGGRGRGRGGGRGGGFEEASWNVWCLNAAVSFAPVAEAARCVIITSGTLAPMAGMEGELGAAFPLKLEASHVIPARQLHVEALAELGEVTYKNYSGNNGPGFFDRLGGVLLARLPAIPNGALCFFSSYSLMERAVERWQETQLWDRINAEKRVVVEGRGADTFTETITSYYDAVPTGAMLLAVCRGKVSEGLDFKGRKARAVFVVGIPFPSFTDTRVKLKQEFNDGARQRQQQRQQQGGAAAAASGSALVLPGHSWYQQQGYRAYNQAIGRCIRNLTDYGAILLVDARFHSINENFGRHRGQLSRWLRSKVQEFHPHESAPALYEFFANLKAEPPVGMDLSDVPGPRRAAKADYNAPPAMSALDIFASNFHPKADDASDEAPTTAATSVFVPSAAPTLKRER